MYFYKTKHKISTEITLGIYTFEKFSVLRNSVNNTKKKRNYINLKYCSKFFHVSPIPVWRAITTKFISWKCPQLSTMDGCIKNVHVRSPIRLGHSPQRLIMSTAPVTLIPRWKSNAVCVFKEALFYFFAKRL